MFNRIVTLLRHWRDVRTSLGTLSRAWGGDSTAIPQVCQAYLWNRARMQSSLTPSISRW